MAYEQKQPIRERVWQELEDQGIARFPYPPHGRIPNFAGAADAAEKLRPLPIYRRARCLKVNPDAPQLPVRAQALRDGKTLLLPTPRLRGRFSIIQPHRVPPGEERRAAALSNWKDYAEEVPPWGLPPVDLVVCGSVAVDGNGARIGKGEGYSDLEYACLRELGNPEVPVVTTVHDVQWVDEVPSMPHDLQVDWIITPTTVHETARLNPQPHAIDWSKLGHRMSELPLLKEIWERKERGLPAIDWTERILPDVIAPSLKLIFVGINPGKRSAESGHHFGGATNLFWKLLAESGLTDRLLLPSEDGLLLDYRLGVTNIVSRSSRGESDLDRWEFENGAEVLKEKLRRYRPRAAAILGKRAYRAFAGMKESDRLDWGIQPRQTVAGVTEFLAPNPSTRSTIPYEDRLQHWVSMRRWLEDAQKDK